MVRFSFYPAPCIRAHWLSLCQIMEKNHCIGQNCVCFRLKMPSKRKQWMQIMARGLFISFTCIFQTVEIFGIYQEMDGDWVYLNFRFWSLYSYRIGSHCLKSFLFVLLSALNNFTRKKIKQDLLNIKNWANNFTHESLRTIQSKKHKYCG